MVVNKENTDAAVPAGDVLRVAAHQNTSAENKKLKCCKTWMPSCSSAAVNNPGRCQSQITAACRIQAASGAVNAAQNAAKPRACVMSAIERRQRSGSAHVQTARGLPKTNSGA